MKPIILILFFTFTQSFSYAQTFELIDSIPVKQPTVQKISTDLNQSLYLISVTKIEKIYSNKVSKNIDLKNIITSVDSNNPLRLYLFSNFNQLSILDEHLNPIQDAVKISSTDFIPTTLKVVDNQFCWFYDLMGNKLIYFNYQLQKPLLTSKQIYFKNNDQSIEAIHTYRHSVYLKGQNTIYKYDDFGNFKTNFLLEIQQSPYLFYNNALYYFKENTFYSTNLETLQTTTLFKSKPIKSFALNETHFYTFDGNNIYIYKR